MLSSYPLVLVTISPTAVVQVIACRLLLTRGALVMSSHNHKHPHCVRCLAPYDVSILSTMQTHACIKRHGLLA